MRNLKIVKLKFLSPLHIGKGVSDSYDSSERILHSDTLSGAIASAFCTLYGGDGLTNFMDNYIVSSAFPFYKEHYFLPRPLQKADITMSDVDEYEAKKKLKKIDYLELPLWEKLIQGQSIVASKDNLLKSKTCLFEEKAPAIGGFYTTEVQQRVAIPRLGGDSRPYYVDRLFFEEDAGLYFFVNMKNNETWDRLSQVLSFLGDNGIGTDKSVGNGQFDFELKEIQVNEPTDANGVILLSLCCPEKSALEESVMNVSNYKLLLRGGFMAGTSEDSFRHLRKKSVYMLTEASVLKTKSIDGRILDVTPQWNDARLHRVVRDGRAFCLPVKC